MGKRSRNRGAGGGKKKATFSGGGRVVVKLKRCRYRRKGGKLAGAGKKEGTT